MINIFTFLTSETETCLCVDVSTKCQDCPSTCIPDNMTINTDLHSLGKGKKDKQRGSILWLLAVSYFLLTELKSIILLHMGDNLKSNINLEKLSKNHIAHRRYLPM